MSPADFEKDVRLTRHGAPRGPQRCVAHEGFGRADPEAGPSLWLTTTRIADDHTLMILGIACEGIKTIRFELRWKIASIMVPSKRSVATSRP